jgi:hypothetical protein
LDRIGLDRPGATVCGIDSRPNSALERFRGLNFASLNFFLFLVRRNSANFASARFGKWFGCLGFGCGSEAKLSEFRLGGVTKLKFSPGEALFVGALRGVDRPSVEQTSGCAGTQNAGTSDWGNHSQGPGIQSTGRASGTQRNSPTWRPSAARARETDQLRKIPPPIFAQLMRFGHRRDAVESRGSRVESQNRGR